MRCLHWRGILDPHERAVARTEQKLRIDESPKQRSTRRSIQTPKTTRLRFGESQPRHFEELALNPPQHVIGSD